MLTSFLTEKSDLSKFVSKQLKDKMIQFILRDLRPFKAGEENSFLSLCQTLVDYGTKYGTFDLHKNVPCQMILSRYVDSLEQEVRIHVKNELQNAKF